MSAGLT